MLIMLGHHKTALAFCSETGMILGSFRNNTFWFVLLLHLEGQFLGVYWACVLHIRRATKFGEQEEQNKNDWAYLLLSKLYRLYRAHIKPLCRRKNDWVKACACITCSCFGMLCFLFGLQPGWISRWPRNDLNHFNFLLSNNLINFTIRGQ